MKKRIIVGACVGAAALLIVIIGIVLFSGRKLTLTDRDKVTRIELMNGNTGKSITLKKDEMAELLDAVYNVSGKKIKISSRTGWVYRITFYNGSECLDDIIVDSDVMWSKDSGYYSVENGAAVYEILKKHWS